MSKRFTETMKWNDMWFRKLESKDKIFWIYLCDQCDFSGVWIPDFEMASLLMGTKIDESSLREFNKDKDRINVMENGSWQIIDFVEFQYGSIDGEDPFHKSLRNLLNKHTSKGAIMPTSKGANKPTKDKDKDKDVVKGGAGGKLKFGQLKNVLLTEDEFQRLQDKLSGHDNAMVMVERLSLYLASKGDKYKSHYATILAWDLKDNGRRMGSAPEYKKPEQKPFDTRLQCYTCRVPLVDNKCSKCGEDFSPAKMKLELKSV